MTSVYPTIERASSRIFVVSPYFPSADGVLKPEMPASCPYPDADDPPCRLALSHFRKRKTGPGFPLAVVRCRTHHKAFTLYPPGHVPYGRQPIIALNPDGSFSSFTPGLDLDGTLFAAAADAAAGIAWEREQPGGAEQYWSTQRRHLAKAMRLLGLEAAVTPSERTAIAHRLDIPALTLSDHAKQICPGYRERGRAVCAVAGRLRRAPVLLSRLLACGHFAGLWGAPYRWDERREVYEDLSFRPQGTGIPPPRE